MRIEIDTNEFQALVSLIDAGVRATGVRHVKTAAVIVAKLEHAAAQAAGNVVPIAKDGMTGEK